MAVHYGFMVVAGSPDELETLLLDARHRLEATGDHAGLVHVWGALGFGVANNRGRYDDWAAASSMRATTACWMVVRVDRNSASR